MDAFYATVAIRRKTRVHFHAFMRDVHEELAKLKREADPLATVAARIAERYRLVCFDEFHVSDIADAMILGRLLDALFDARRRVRDDVELSAGRAVPGRPAARRTSCRRSSCCDAGSTWSRSTAASTTGCARSSSAERVPHAGRRGGRTRRWRSTFDAMAQRPRRGPDARRSRAGRCTRSGARAARSGSTSPRCATARARSATISSSPGASR